MRNEPSVDETITHQGGVITHQQLLAAGWSPGQIHRAREAGWLIDLHRGVYAVGHICLFPEAFRVAALLAVPNGVLSHWTAAAFWGFAKPRTTIELVRLGSGAMRLEGGLVVRRTTTLRGDRVRRNGFTVTRPPRTLLDLAATTDDEHKVSEAFWKADRLRLLSESHLAQTLDRHRGERGVPMLAKLAETHKRRRTSLTDSELERYMLDLLDKHDLEPPVTQHQIGIDRVDFSWPERRLIVEADSWEWHSSSAAMEKDRRRDRRLGLQGWTVLRYTHGEIVYDQITVAEELTTWLARSPRAEDQHRGTPRANGAAAQAVGASH